MGSSVNDDKGSSVDRNKAIGILAARAMAAEVFGNKERCKAFTEAAQIIKTMPQSNPHGKNVENARNDRK